MPARRGPPAADNPARMAAVEAVADAIGLLRDAAQTIVGPLWRRHLDRLLNQPRRRVSSS